MHQGDKVIINFGMTAGANTLIALIPVLESRDVMLTHLTRKLVYEVVYMKSIINYWKACAGWGLMWGWWRWSFRILLRSLRLEECLNK